MMIHGGDSRRARRRRRIVRICNRMAVQVRTCTIYIYLQKDKIGRNAHKERQLQFEEFDRSPPLSKQHKVS